MNDHQDQTKAADGRPSLIDGLGADLERDLRAAINPQYEDVRGTESFERKRLLGEIDRLRKAIQQTLDENGHLADGDNCTLIALKRALVPNVKVSGASDDWPPLDCLFMPLPCPFCGEKSITIREGSTFRWVQVECLACGATCGEVRGHHNTTEPGWKDRASQDAIHDWNMRDGAR